MIQGHEEFVLNQEMRDARILEKTKILSELTQQRDTLQSRMAETHTSKEEETYQNILSRIAEIEADLAEEERILRVAPLALNAITPNARVLSSAAIDFAVSTPEEYKDEEIQHQHRMEGTPVYKEDKLTRAGATSTFGPQLANGEEVRAQAYRELLNDKQKLQSLEGLIKRLHQLFVNSFDPKAFDLYIEPQVKDRDTGVEYSAFKRLGDFVVQADAASMLVAGDPGMGKTLLSLQIAQQSWYLFIREHVGTLLRDPYWANVLASYEKQGFAQIVAPLFSPTDEKSEEPATEKTISLPLWLWMPFLRTEKNWEQRLLETHLKQSGLFPEDIALLKQTCQQYLLCLLPIMDGWDELPPVKENLYLHSGFWEEEHWPYLKVLSTCRPEAFVHYEKQGGYKSIFHPKQGVGTYTILNLSSFESRHINAYVDRYVSTLPEDYQPPISIPVPDVPVDQARIWDQAKAAWCADYEARYFPLFKTAKPQEEKEDTADAAVAAAGFPVPDWRNAKTYRHYLAAKPQEKKEDTADASVTAVGFSVLDWRNTQTYQYYLQYIPGLSQLIQTPFVLSAVVQVLPSIVAYQVEQSESQPSITRYKIYQYFVDYWLTAQAKRLWQDKEKQWDLVDFRMESEQQSIEKLKACLFTYSENLARFALNLGGGKFEVNLSDEDTLNLNLVIPASGPRHFEKEEVEIKKIQLIRSGCLLQNLGNTFKFLHKSLVEFFAAKALFSGAHIAADSYLRRFDAAQDLNKDLSLNKQLLTSEPNIIRLLADQARDDIDFKYLLYQIIELSKCEPAVEKAAANAITILNVAGESFSGRDFRSVHICGAILNNALCDQTDFEGADLRDMKVHNAWLQKANLSHAQVSGLDFQELPRIKHTSEVASFCISSFNKWLLVGDKKGCVTQYAYPEGKRLQQWNLNSLLSTYEISCLTLRSDEKLIAANFGEGVQLIDIQGGKLVGVFFKPVGTAIQDGKLLQESWKDSGFYHFDCTCTTFCYTQGQYLAIGVQINFITAYNEIVSETWGPQTGTVEHTKRRWHTSYIGQHLQLWNVEEHRFLGEYRAGSQFKIAGQFEQLSTSNQGHILITRSGHNIFLFSILGYTQGQLTPVQTLCSKGPFALSQDERFLGVSQKNTIQLYQMSVFKPLPNVIRLKERQECKGLAFNYQGNLLIVRLDTQLHIWDVSSCQRLYALPIPVSKKVELCFSLSTDISNVFISIDDILYIWPLDQFVDKISYPFKLMNLSTPLLENIKSQGKLDTNFLSIENNKYGKIQIYDGKLKKTITLPYEYYWLWGNVEHGEIPTLLLSVNQDYLVNIVVINRFNKGVDMYVRVWDLHKYCIYAHFKIKHSASQNRFYKYFLSMDGEWLISAVQSEIFIHRLKDGKKLAKFILASFSSYTLPFMLSANKFWLAVADYNQCLSIFDVATQKCLFHLKGLPIRIKKLNWTINNQYLIAGREKNEDGVLIFRVIQKEKDLILRLVNTTMKINLVCGEINIESIYGLSENNQLLLEQNNARGVPARSAQPVAAASPPENKESETDIEIERALNFNRAVVRRDNVNSFLNSRAVLNYDAWQVALVRDKESRSNSEHTFIVVEGMDAFGRCFFWRFDLVTRVGDVTVEKGFAKVNVQRYNDLLLSERESILQVFLNPHEIQGRGLESLAGHVWQLKREKVLDLYKAVIADQEKGLLPYALTGNRSFFTTGDNCYSWARRHLLALKEPKIEKELPSTSADYFVMRPKWKLQESLIAAQHVKREAALGPCRSM